MGKPCCLFRLYVSGPRGRGHSTPHTCRPVRISLFPRGQAQSQVRRENPLPIVSHTQESPPQLSVQLVFLTTWERIRQSSSFLPEMRCPYGVHCAQCTAMNKRNNVCFRPKGFTIQGREMSVSHPFRSKAFRHPKHTRHEEAHAAILSNLFLPSLHRYIPRSPNTSSTRLIDLAHDQGKSFT